MIIGSDQKKTEIGRKVVIRDNYGFGGSSIKGGSSPLFSWKMVTGLQRPVFVFDQLQNLFGRGGQCLPAPQQDPDGPLGREF